jgi:general stress protein 26
MATATKQDIQSIARLLAKLDIGMLTTKAEDGTLHGRPMSNNGEVEYDGDSWFFAEDGSRKVTEIEADPAVELGFIDTEAGTWINVEGEATIIRDDEERKRELWLDDLERWFPNGPEDPNIVLIKVHARHIDAWAKDEEWQIDVRD